MKKGVVLGLAFLVVGGWTVIGAQEVPVPFTWVGKAQASILTDQGVETLDFQVDLGVDAQGVVNGKTFIDEGSIPIEKLYYGPENNGARRLVLVVSLYDDENPTLFILHGRTLQNHFFYGEVFTKKLESQGEIEKGLSLTEHTAVELYGENDLPANLKNAIKACRPLGCFMIKGDFKKE